MYEVTQKDVLVDICNPETGDKLGEQVQHVSVTAPITDASQVRTDTADMYSIEVMNSVGLPPIVCNGHYIINNLKSYDSAKMLSSSLLSQIEQADEQLKIKESFEVKTESASSDVTPKTE